ncbi:AbrB/MazE/SpoVT family DNA-binding domain-containing protein [Candidatus Woesearchaeota archaeon]|nr:AbrB/MazE/SpoVT family DNA-binding domain-containing protein [Candidatus Woesearchaeota archaeon]MBD3283319.1 AbrB/MazE/SpoVT family DNA-binding domain-containing protein [Candidatus Pacearchaeota archaeon]
METVKVSSRGQIVIPEKIRKKLNIKKGTKLIMTERGKKIILEHEKDFLKRLAKYENKKEDAGWLMIAEKNISKLWDNPRDEEIWSKYL